MSNNNVLSEIARLESATFSDPWSEEMLKDTIKYEYNRIFVLLADGKIIDMGNAELRDMSVIGYLICSCVAGETELQRIAISEGSREKGFGYKLLDYYIKTVQNDNEKGFLEVRESNLMAIRLYEKYGYKQIAIRKNYYKDPCEAAIIYQIDLPVF